ncbi:MAG: cyclic nucleotide-binding domain-containing protein [Myxococcales bacterium]|nr:cyclic nucleotide-binding domain-containing protein [Myxococcales bacterium]
MNRPAFGLAVLMIFAVNVAAIALRSYAEAAFLASYGAEWIPVLLVSQAVAFAIGTLAYDAITGRAPSATVDVALGVALTVAAATAPTLIAYGGAWPFVVALSTTTLASVANVALWNTVAATVAGRDARRMLPRAGAVLTAGGALAGFAAAGAAAKLGAASVPRLSAGFAVLTVIAAIGAQRALARGGAPGMAAPPGASPELSVDHRALLRWLAIAAIAESAVATALEFRFGAALKTHWHGGDLATAVGLFHGGTHTIQLVLQALVIPRLLTSQRLPVTVSIHPTLTAVGALALIGLPGFAALAVLRTGEKVLRSATSRTGQELTLSALPPRARARWKVLLRGLFTPLGAALAAAVLILFRASVLMRPLRFGAALVAVTVVLGVAMRRAARRFVAALAAPLGMRGVAIGERARERLDLDELRRLVDATGDADGALARAALVRSGGRADDVSPHLAHDEPTVRQALYEIAARRPSPAAATDLIAAVQIEDDPDARYAGLAALAAHGARDAIGELDPALVADADVARALRAARAEVNLATPAERAAAVAELIERDGAWAARIARPCPPEGYDDAALAGLAGPGRAQAMIAATAGGPRALAAMLDALIAGDPDASAAVAALEDGDALAMVARLPTIDRSGRAALARARAAAPHPGPLLDQLATDDDPDVRAAALRSLASHARAGGAPSAALAAACVERERAALAVLVAARATDHPALHAAELTRSIRRATRRLVLAVALGTAAAGRDPLPLLAAGRRMLDAPEPLRRRALDLLQEVATAPLPVLDLLEASLRPPSGAAAPADVARVDPWLAELLAGGRRDHEAGLAALRQCQFFDDLAGDHVDELAAAAPRRAVAAGAALVTAGERGDALYAVLAGELVGEGAPPPRFGPGAVLGELALIDDAPRAMTLRAVTAVEVLVIERATFARALARWPELGGALLRTLAARG